MKKKNNKNQSMRSVALNCSQFSPIAAMQASVNNEQVRTCEVCKKWDGKKCSIGLYDVISKSIEAR